MAVTDLAAAFRNALLADATFATAIGDRVYANEGPLNATFPMCVVTLVTQPISENYFDGDDALEALFQVDLWGHFNEGLNVLEELNVYLFGALQRASIAPSGYDRGVVSCVDRGAHLSEGDWLRITSEWEVEATITDTTPPPATLIGSFSSAYASAFDVSA
jgi:hypothetical protein